MDIFVCMPVIGNGPLSLVSVCSSSLGASEKLCFMILGSPG